MREKKAQVPTILASTGEHPPCPVRAGPNVPRLTEATAQRAANLPAVGARVVSPGRRLAAVVFLDLAEFTSLAQVDEPGALRLLDELDKVLRPILQLHGGRLVKSMGDGRLIEFPNALDALEWAVDFQRHVHDRNQRVRTVPLRPRVGIHLGDVEAQGEDILGDAVNVASRIEPLAEPGGICISAPVHDQVHLKARYRFRPMGANQLKGVREPMNAYETILPWTERAEPSATPALATTRLAVLPFANISPNPEDAYFADGMTEQLISTLSRLPGLQVISRTSVMRYKGSSKTIGEIGVELRAGSILEGSVRKASDELRITAQLINAVSDETLWSQDFDRKLDAVFDIQGEIARSVSDALKVHLLERDRSSLKPQGTGSTDAFAMYLKGRAAWNERSQGGHARAVDFFERAIRLDSDFGLAHAGLAAAWLIAGDYEWLKPADSFPRAKASAERAISLDPRLAEPHAVLGLVSAHREWNWKGAEREFRTALDLEPSNATVHHWFGVHLCLPFGGRLEEALEHLRQARELDPYSVPIGTATAQTLLTLGRVVEAADECRRIIEVSPDLPNPHDAFGFALLLQHDPARAIEELSQASALSEGDPSVRADLAFVLGSAGRLNEAERILDDLKRRAQVEYVSQGQLAKILFGLGRVDEGFRYLNGAFEERSIGFLDFATAPWFAKVREDGRWAVLARRAGL